MPTSSAVLGQDFNETQYDVAHTSTDTSDETAVRLVKPNGKLPSQTVRPDRLGIEPHGRHVRSDTDFPTETTNTRLKPRPGVSSPEEEVTDPRHDVRETVGNLDSQESAIEHVKPKRRVPTPVAADLDHTRNETQSSLVQIGGSLSTLAVAKVTAKPKNRLLPIETDPGQNDAETHKLVARVKKRRVRSTDPVVSLPQLHALLNHYVNTRWDIQKTRFSQENRRRDLAEREVDPLLCVLLDDLIEESKKSEKAIDKTLERLMRQHPMAAFVKS